MQENKVKEFFDKNSREWDRNYESKSNNLTSWYLKNRKKIVLSMFDFRKSKVLEVGCGTGIFSVEILKRGNKLWGIDISPKMIKEAKKKVKNEGLKAVFSTGDICNLKFQNNFFDTVVVIGVMSYIEEDDKAFSELSRVLKKGGILIITVGNKYSPDYLSRKFFNFFLKHLKSNKLIFQNIQTKAYSQREINQILEENNFDVIDYANYNYKFFPFHKILPSLFVYLSKKIHPKSKFSALSAEKILKLRKVK